MPYGLIPRPPALPVDVYSALDSILTKMPLFVRKQAPRVPNPVNPAEDFADCWSRDSQYEQNFWLWHSQVKADLHHLWEAIGGKELPREIHNQFRLDLTTDQTRSLEAEFAKSTPRVITATPVISIPAAPKPWGSDA